MTRMQQFQAEVNENSRKVLRAKMGGGKMVFASFCGDLPNQWLSSSWTEFKIAAGSIITAAWIKENGFEKCRKSDATCCLIVGEKSEGHFVAGKHKNFWLKLAANV